MFSRIVLFCVAFAVVAAAVLSAGCGGESRPRQGGTVVAAFYPLAFAAEQVGGDARRVSNLTPPAPSRTISS